MSKLPTYDEFLNESTFLPIGGDYWNLYIANKDTQVKNDKGRNINIGNGTVIHSAGGGWWKSVDGKIAIGINVLEGNPDFDVVNDSTWPNIVDLTKEIENWARKTKDRIQRDPKKAQAVINNRSRVIEDIRKLLK